MAGSGHAEGRARTMAPTRRLSGWSPADLRRWPGRTAAGLHLRALSSGESDADHSGCSVGPECSDHWDGLLAYMAMNRSWIDGVVIDGPDTTGDPDLTSLLAALAEAGISTRLVTNGMHPRVLAHAIAEQLLASISLSVPVTWEQTVVLAGSSEDQGRMAASVSVLVDSAIDHDFVTVVDPASFAVQELEALAAHLCGGRLYALQVETSARGLADRELVTLRAAARGCCAYLPTIVRDAG